MASYIEFLLNPALAIDFLQQTTHQFVSGWGWTTPDWNVGSSFPPSGSGNSSGSGTGSGIGNCLPTGSVSISGGPSCTSGSGVVTPN
ncbi:hypothetical protein [Nocardia huaxiensis]|uniref:Uncharacterized protein n=1 Tax=Nocardia huaxiensis TaxID=2755382 RepID=A0A7D6ZEC7_9NOCA|nr:hypothetical protein [Nocardia huaxiensis]QLY31638.1 hypothetical protein H0264_04735 [Nocardia huaxiensis]UFS95191.1 hypothetical protein LPY97_31565 [Nocardia huaxiensis]